MLLGVYIAYWISREDPTLLPPRTVNTHLLFSARPTSPGLVLSHSPLDNSLLSLQLKGDLDSDGFFSVLLAFLFQVHIHSVAKVSVSISPESYGSHRGRLAAYWLLLSLLSYQDQGGLRPWKDGDMTASWLGLKKLRAGSFILGTCCAEDEPAGGNLA